MRSCHACSHADSIVAITVLMNARGVDAEARSGQVGLDPAIPRWTKAGKWGQSPENVSFVKVQWSGNESAHGNHPTRSTRKGGGAIIRWSSESDQSEIVRSISPGVKASASYLVSSENDSPRAGFPSCSLFQGDTNSIVSVTWVRYVGVNGRPSSRRKGN